VSAGIVYFNLDQASADDLNRAMPKLEKARGIVFDMRGYPGDGAIELIQHLIDAPATSQRWILPIFRRPDREGVQWLPTERWNLEPRSPRLTAKTAFLIDGRAISYAESIMGIVEHYKLGEIVGSTTAGTNGNINPFMLPGGFLVTWSGMIVLKHDGGRHHGVGIAPTVRVVPTPTGIADGKDEVLERAVAVLEAKLGPGNSGSGGSP
jgi:C-terminal processing protease CtpA/Prc